MVNKALIVTDVINDFMPGGALPVPKGDTVIEPINRMIDWCKNEENWIIILVGDWHPKDSKHFEKWPVHAVANTVGAEFHPDLKILPNAIIIYKGLDPNEDGNSALEGIAWNGFELDDILKGFSVEEVFVCGVATEICVKVTALDAVKNGYKTFILLDACRALTPESGEKAVKEMKEVGVVITTTDDIIKREEK